MSEIRASGVRRLSHHNYVDVILRMDLYDMALQHTRKAHTIQSLLTASTRSAVFLTGRKYSFLLQPVVFVL